MSGELFASLIKVIPVQMHVAKRVNEFARLQAGDLRHHHGQQSVTCDVEGDSEKEVGTSLIQLA